MSEAASHLRASGGSLVPDTLMELREATLLKKCLNEGGTSLPFLEERPQQEDERGRQMKEQDEEEGEEKFSEFNNSGQH